MQFATRSACGRMPFESLFNWFLFELPTAYGMEPRPGVEFLAALVFIFAIPYTIML